MLHLLALLLHFNSIKVQLEPASSPLALTPVLNFNSIKVQLEPVNP